MTPDRYDYTRLPTCGKDFEQYVGSVFADLGYGVDITQLSGDYGADVILTEPDSGRRIAVQAKFYGKQLGNTPVQEVVGSLAHYGAAEGWVVTNSTFSDPACVLAEENGVRLIDGQELNGLVTAAIDNRARTAPGEAAPWRRLDFSGLEVMPEGPVPGEERHRPELIFEGRPVPQWSSGFDSYASNVLDQGTEWDHSGKETRPHPAVAQKSDWRDQVLNMSDVAARWHTTDYQVRKQLANGLPLFKQPNGRWAISAGDLVDWEERKAERDAQMHRRQRVLNVIYSLATIALLLVLVVIVVFAMDHPLNF